MRESDFIHHVASSHRGSLLGGPFQFSNRGNISKYKSAFADAVKNFGQNGITDFSSVNSDWLKTNIVNFDASNCGRYNVLPSWGEARVETHCDEHLFLARERGK